MFHHILPKNTCCVCGRRCYEDDKRRCSGNDKLVCDSWLENNKSDIVLQNIKNIEERLKVELPPLDELMIVNRRGLYLGWGEYVYHPKTDKFWICMVSGNIPLLQSEHWEKLEPRSRYCGGYNAYIGDILKKRLFEENNKGEWSANSPEEIIKASKDCSHIDYEKIEAFNEEGPFKNNFAEAAIVKS